MRWSQAFRVFFRILRDPAFAEQVARVEATAEPVAAPVVQPPASSGARRSEALLLLAALQREGRFVDFLQEGIDEYPDAQVGSAVREVHRACRKVLERFFSLTPVMSQQEGSRVRIDPGYDPGRIRLIGQIAGDPPHTGALVHPGWEATRCDLPEWTGSEAAARVVAPAEVEIQP